MNRPTLFDNDIGKLAVQRNIALSMIRDDVGDILRENQQFRGDKFIKVDNLFGIVQNLENKGELRAQIERSIIGQQNIQVEGNFSQVLINSRIINQNIQQIVKNVIEQKTINVKQIETILKVISSEERESQLLKRQKNILLFKNNRIGVAFFRMQKDNLLKKTIPKLTLKGYSGFTTQLHNDCIKFLKTINKQVLQNGLTSFNGGRVIKSQFLTKVRGRNTSGKFTNVFKYEDNYQIYHEPKSNKVLMFFTLKSQEPIEKIRPIEFEQEMKKILVEEEGEAKDLLFSFMQQNPITPLKSPQTTTTIETIDLGEGDELLIQSPIMKEQEEVPETTQVVDTKKVEDLFGKLEGSELTDESIKQALNFDN